MTQLTFIQRLTIVTCALTLLFSAVAHSQDYIIKVSRLAIRKTPQSGDWRAGVDLQLYSRFGSFTDKAMWHGGETTFEGPNAVLPVNFVLNVPKVAEYIIGLSIGIDDDAEDAGTSEAEDKTWVEATVKMNNVTKEQYHVLDKDGWYIIVYYTVKKIVPMKPRNRQ